MAIKIPYHYTVYPESHLATEFDKITHGSGTSVAIGFVLFFVTEIPVVLLYRFIPEEAKKCLGLPICVLTILHFIFFFIVFPIILPKLCDRFRWSEKIAARKVRKNEAYCAALKKRKSEGNETVTDDREPNANEWKCPACGRINQNYVGSCGCGGTRSKAE